MALLSAIGIGACSTPRRSASEQTPSPGVRTELDEERGFTLTIVAAPLVLARSRSDVAANVRDYVTLVAVQEDNSGKYATWLVVHHWSTVDPRMPGAGWYGDGRLILVADGRVLTLSPTSPAPDLLHRGEWLYAPVVRSARSYAYAVDIATLRYLAAARVLTVHFDGDPIPQGYSIWQDGRAALRTWLESAVDVTATER